MNERPPHQNNEAHQAAPTDIPTMAPTEKALGTEDGGEDGNNTESGMVVIRSQDDDTLSVTESDEELTSMSGEPKEKHDAREKEDVNRPEVKPVPTRARN